MRILYWVPAFWPQIGGVEVIAAHFLPAMQARGHQFVVIASQGSLGAAAESDFRGIPVYRFPLWQAIADRDVTQIAAIRERIAAIVRAFHPDLTHLNFFPPSLFFHATTPTSARTPLLVSFRGKPPVEIAAPETVGHRVLAAADWVTAVAQSALDEARRLVPEISPRSSVICNGMPLVRPRIINLPVNPPRLLCVGRLVRDKGFDLTLTALAALRSRFPSLKMTIVGDGNERSELERQAATLGLNGAVTFTGWVTPSTVLDLMNTATIVVAPSRVDEGLPGVAIQAAFMARPVVAASVSGFSEIVVHNQTGLLVPPDDAGALATGIAQLLNDENRAASFGAAARQRAEQRFDWNVFVDAYDRLYHQLTKEIVRC